MNFYSKYLSLCADKGISPTAAGVEMGFSRATVNRWKNGSEPSDNNKIVIADYFSVSPLEFHETDDEKEKAPSVDEASPAKQELLRMIDEMDEQQLLKVTLLIKMAKEL